VNGVAVLNVGITTRCNFTCGFCWGRHLPQGDLPLSLLEEVLDHFPSARYLDLTGEGEPTLHPQLLAMARRARDRGMTLGLYTNGSLLDRMDVDEVLDAGFDVIAVSLESADRARFAAIRGGRLDIVEKGLARLMRRRNERGLSLPSVQLAVSVLRDEREEFHRIVQLYRDLGLDGGIVCQSLNRRAGYARYYPDELAAQMLAPEEEQAFLRGVDALPESRKVGSGQSFFEALHDGFDPASRACPWLENGVFVRHDGLVSPCCEVKEPTLSYGRIGHDSWEEMGAVRDRMRAQLAVGVTPEACLGCETARHAVARPSTRDDDEQDLRGELESLAARAERARAEADALRASRSWRIADPLRRVAASLRSIRRTS
jgi:MoaA/NifB/PqqE/SkfB family radical SAM enzyme